VNFPVFSWAGLVEAPNEKAGIERGFPAKYRPMKDWIVAVFKS